MKTVEDVKKTTEAAQNSQSRWSRVISQAGERVTCGVKTLFCVIAAECGGSEMHFVSRILFVMRFSGGANLRLDAFNFRGERQERVMFCKVCIQFHVGVCVSFVILK